MGSSPILASYVLFKYVLLNYHWSMEHISRSLILVKLKSDSYVKVKICFGYENKNASTVGFEPTTSGLEVRRAIHCATRTHTPLLAKINN